MLHSNDVKSVAVVGGGPAGLMAAEVLADAGVAVDVYDAMPSVGRKFLLAGVGGMNITHSEAKSRFLSRYGERRPQIEAWLADFDADALRSWVSGLGIDTFIGSSGRVFPKDMKAAPLLRAWLHRLRESGVRFHVRHRWLGWAEDQQQLCFESPQGKKIIAPDATVMALGGASWARLGSDGAWAPLFEQRGVSVQRLQPANCGFNVSWSEHVRTKFAGSAVKSVVASAVDGNGVTVSQQGEFVVTADGIEGSLVYALSALLRDQITAQGEAVLLLDLLPGKDMQRLIRELTYSRGSKSMASHLRSRAGIEGVKASLLREFTAPDDFRDPVRLASAIKALPLRLVATRPIDEAISTAGGVAFDALDERLMTRKIPGLFCAGEMLDWEAPTGGYLLTACFASGRAAGLGALAWLGNVAASP